MVAQKKFTFSRHLGFFLQNLCLTNINLIQKTDWKNTDNIQSYAKKLILIRHLGSIHHFYLPHMEYEGSIGLVMRKMKIFYC
jgi:hypothetical protein